MLEDRARLAAMTESTIAGFSSQLSSRLGGDIARNQTHRNAWADILRSGDDAGVIHAVENHALALMGFVRAYSDARREAFEENQAFEKGTNQ